MDQEVIEASGRPQWNPSHSKDEEGPLRLSVAPTSSVTPVFLAPHTRHRGKGRSVLAGLHLCSPGTVRTSHGAGLGGGACLGAVRAFEARELGHSLNAHLLNLALHEAPEQNRRGERAVALTPEKCMTS